MTKIRSILDNLASLTEGSGEQSYKDVTPKQAYEWVKSRHWSLNQLNEWVASILDADESKDIQEDFGGEQAMDHTIDDYHRRNDPPIEHHRSEPHASIKDDVDNVRHGLHRYSNMDGGSDFTEDFENILKHFGYKG